MPSNGVEHLRSPKTDPKPGDILADGADRITVVDVRETVFYTRKATGSRHVESRRTVSMTHWRQIAAKWIVEESVTR